MRRHYDSRVALATVRLAFASERYQNALTAASLTLIFFADTRGYNCNRLVFLYLADYQAIIMPDEEDIFITGKEPLSQTVFRGSINILFITLSPAARRTPAYRLFPGIPLITAEFGFVFRIFISEKFSPAPCWPLILSLAPRDARD